MCNMIIPLKQSLVLWTAIGLFSLLLTSQAHAGQPTGTDLGVLGGLAIANQNEFSGTHLDLGATGHALLVPQVNVGFYYQYYWNNYSQNGTTHNHTIAGELNYLFPGTFEGVYAGGKVGLQLVGNSAPNTQSSTDLVFGPALGYDYPLEGNFSIGGQANVLFVTQSPVITDWNLLAVLKLNF